MHIHSIAQGHPEDNQVEFLQGPPAIVNPPKNLVLNNIRRFTQMANGLSLLTSGDSHAMIAPAMKISPDNIKRLHGHGSQSSSLTHPNEVILGLPLVNAKPFTPT